MDMLAELIELREAVAKLRERVAVLEAQPRPMVTFPPPFVPFIPPVIYETPGTAKPSFTPPFEVTCKTGGH